MNNLGFKEFFYLKDFHSDQQFHEVGLFSRSPKYLIYGMRFLVFYLKGITLMLEGSRLVQVEVYCDGCGGNLQYRISRCIIIYIENKPQNNLHAALINVSCLPPVHGAH